MGQYTLDEINQMLEACEDAIGDATVAASHEELMEQRDHLLEMRDQAMCNERFP
tara:strand:+ start:9567 stop:9728 length:162 start_codon:yes stop_codon:yes gene_type:complete